MKKFAPLKNPSSWRRLSIATWGPPNDPTVYGTISLDATAALAFLEKINSQNSSKITMTHLVSKAIALTIKKFPDLNGIIRFQKIYLRESVDVFIQVAIDGELEGKRADLSGAVITHCDSKSLNEIATELKNKSTAVRKGDDPQFKSSLNLLSWVPALLLSPLIKLMTFIMYDLGISLQRFGIPEDPFGSAMVTSVGMLKVPPAFAPLVPMSRVPLILCVGEVKEKPCVINGQLAVRPALKIMCTFDHRFIDGLIGSRMVRYFQEILQNPEKYLGS